MAQCGGGKPRKEWWEILEDWGETLMAAQSKANVYLNKLWWFFFSHLEQENIILTVNGFILLILVFYWKCHFWTDLVLSCCTISFSYVDVQWICLFLCRKFSLLVKVVHCGCLPARIKKYTFHNFYSAAITFVKGNHSRVGSLYILSVSSGGCLYLQTTENLGVIFFRQHQHSALYSTLQLTESWIQCASVLVHWKVAYFYSFFLFNSLVFFAT